MLAIEVVLNITAKADDTCVALELLRGYDLLCDVIRLSREALVALFLCVHRDSIASGSNSQLEPGSHLEGKHETSNEAGGVVNTDVRRCFLT